MKSDGIASDNLREQAAALPQDESVTGHGGVGGGGREAFSYPDWAFWRIKEIAMIKTLKLTSIVMLSSLILGCASFPFDHAYVGKVRSVIPRPVETVFYQDAKGEILGLYVYYEGSKQIPGILDSCKLNPNRVLNCQWRDSSGSGNFAAEFSFWYTEFNGAWGGLYEDVLAHGSSWNGKK